MRTGIAHLAKTRHNGFDTIELYFCHDERIAGDGSGAIDTAQKLSSIAPPAQANPDYPSAAECALALPSYLATLLKHQRAIDLFFRNMHSLEFPALVL